MKSGSISDSFSTGKDAEDENALSHNRKFAKNGLTVCLRSLEIVRDILASGLLTLGYSHFFDR